MSVQKEGQSVERNHWWADESFQERRWCLGLRAHAGAIIVVSP